MVTQDLITVLVEYHVMQLASVKWPVRAGNWLLLTPNHRIKALKVTISASIMR